MLEAGNVSDDAAAEVGVIVGAKLRCCRKSSNVAAEDDECDEEEEEGKEEELVTGD